jgi:hypothetical protein
MCPCFSWCEIYSIYKVTSVTFAEIEKTHSSSRGEYRRFGPGAPLLEEMEEIQ